MSSTIFFFFFIPLLAFILLGINLLFAPHNPYQEKNSAFECGFTSFLGQNRTQFSISFFIFALLFLLFDLEILLVYPYLVSAYTNETYGLVIILIFLLALTLGFAFELGKKALSIDSRQTTKVNNIPKPHNLVTLPIQSKIFSGKALHYFKLVAEKWTFSALVTRLFVVLPGIAFLKHVVYEGSLGFYAYWVIGLFALLCISILGVILDFHFNELGININLHECLFGSKKCMPNDDSKYESYVGKSVIVKKESNIPSLQDTPLKRFIHKLDVSSLEELEKRISNMPIELILHTMDLHDEKDMRDLMHDYQAYKFYRKKVTHVDDVERYTRQWYEEKTKEKWDSIMSKANHFDRTLYIFKKYAPASNYEAFEKRVNNEMDTLSKIPLFKYTYKNANGEFKDHNPISKVTVPKDIHEFIKQARYHNEELENDALRLATERHRHFSVKGKSILN